MKPKAGSFKELQLISNQISGFQLEGIFPPGDICQCLDIFLVVKGDKLLTSSG